MAVLLCIDAAAPSMASADEAPPEAPLPAGSELTLHAESMPADDSASLRDEVVRLREQVRDLRDELAVLRGERPEPVFPMWDLEVDLAAAVFRGNIQDVMLQSSVTFTLEHPARYRLRAGAQYEFQGVDDQTQQQRVDFLAGYALLPNDRLSPFLFAETGFNEVRKLSWRLDAGIGVRLTVLRDPFDPVEFKYDPHASYSLSVAAVYNRQHYQPHANTAARTFVRIDVRIDAEQRIVGGLHLGNRFRVFAAVQNTSILLLRNETYARFVLGESYWLRAIYAFQEDTNPAPGVRRVDHEFQLAFSARFGR